MAPSQDRSEALERSYWLAARGAQQMDLAQRFAAIAESHGLRVLALKGISIADQLYGGVWNRPMADVDFLVVDTKRFESAASLSLSLGLVETGASDHALVFKEPVSGVVLELHIALTACPGLFSVDHEALWERRAAVPQSPLFRLGDADLVVHLALHTAFQHGFMANEYHYGDFVRSLNVLGPSHEQILSIARGWTALKTLAAMSLMARKRDTESLAVATLASLAGPFCPPALGRWIDARGATTPLTSIATLAFVRYQLAPSRWGYLRRALAPTVIPGRTLKRPRTLRRLASIMDAALFSPAPPRR